MSLVSTKSRRFLFLCIWLVLVAVPAFAATIVVTTTSDTNDGVCDANCSLREAVSASSNGDVIVFSPLFNSPQTITLTSGQISISKNLTIAGPGSSLLTVSGNNNSRIFYISNNATVAMSGLKLTNGRAGTSSDHSGGAIFLIDSLLNIVDIKISNNLARYTIINPPPQQETIVGFGGGVYCANSTFTATNSNIIGNTSANGGGIYSTRSTVSFINSAVNNNSGFGGIYSRLSTINLTNSEVNNNTQGGVLGFELDTIRASNTTINGNSGYAVLGSGISLANVSIIGNYKGVGHNSDAPMTIDRSIIKNTLFGGTGGGIYNSGLATITNTVISNNRTNEAGGGIFNSGGTVYIFASAIVGNFSQGCGGGIITSGQLFLTNSTVSGNVADSGVGSINRGGGICNSGSGSMMFTNSTIANNRASGEAGGVLHNSTGSAIIRNTIIASNLSSFGAIDISGAVNSQGFNLIGSSTGSFGWLSSDRLNQDPRLAPLGNNGGSTLTHALMPTSPAINGGSNMLVRDPADFLFSYDQRGFQRFVGGIVDIGAYESSIADSPVTLSGRVTTSTGRGISKARITLTDAAGTIIYSQTNPFGYYRFLNLPPGTTYTITVIHKSYQFDSPQSVTVDTNRNDLNFIAR